ncbi:hypothetical protein TWF694_002968 [Orbilia ellipsospora]|uniref:Uncharacterized protein n=1 Tax=Orbilia ellipsospora TaxID=2528407 RepID=A0AAV9X083_9PEZI
MLLLRRLPSLRTVLILGILFTTSVLAVPAPEADPKAVPNPIPDPQARYRIEDIAPVTTSATAEDEDEYGNMKSYANSTGKMLTGMIQYYSDAAREANIAIHFKHEDVGRCVQWIAIGRCPIKQKDVKYDTGSNSVMWATKIRFNPDSILDAYGNTWGRAVLFFSDRYCKRIIGVQQRDWSGVMERPAVLSLLQADIRGDQGRASIYLQTIRLPPLFYTMIMA